MSVNGLSAIERRQQHMWADIVLRSPGHLATRIASRTQARATHV